ncbi:MAG: sigma-54-dependent Fis family transcriptional regulator [Desulfobacterales bacterium]|nr:MAG: sigma-54-dependent Fis family transcriptional regulator [Desulfobacterales bacterium]
MEHSIIVVDDEQDFLESIRRGLITSGFKNVRIESDPRKVASIFEDGETFDIALIDITMPEMDGIELLEVVRSTSPTTECLMVTALDEARVAMRCLRKGAYDYLVKPISKEDLILSINRALERKRLVDIVDLGKRKTLPKLVNVEAFRPIVTESDKVMRILKEAELHAGSDVPILITGETGTGKELLAKAIHAASPRANFLFTAINMDSVTPQLFDAEFFGHTRGAFTGAEKERVGYLEHTNAGTLFLDEIGNLPLELQGKLLRVLQEGEYTKLGTSQLQKTNVRFIAATNANLERLMAQKRFRKDLYYRLRGGWLHLPPLRERKYDIPLLMRCFLEEFSGSAEQGIFKEEALELLMEYDYPGNVRELKSIIQSAVNLAQGKPISSDFLPNYLRRPKMELDSEQPVGSESIASLAKVEKAHILKVYSHTDNNKSQTARLLGIGLNTLRRKLEAYGVE